MELVDLLRGGVFTCEWKGRGGGFTGAYFVYLFWGGLLMGRFGEVGKVENACLELPGGSSSRESIFELLGLQSLVPQVLRILPCSVFVQSEVEKTWFYLS